MMQFVKENKWMTISLMVSIIVILGYIISFGYAEWFSGAGMLLTVLSQLAIGYVINFIFFVTQIYIPTLKRSKIIKAQIASRIDKVVKHIKFPIDALASIYLTRTATDRAYTADELFKILKSINVDDPTRIVNGFLKGESTYWSVRDWILKCINEVEKEIDHIYSYYADSISGALMEALDNVENSLYHKHLKDTWPGTHGIKFDKVNNDYFLGDYYRMIGVLERIKEEYAAS